MTKKVSALFALSVLALLPTAGGAQNQPWRKPSPAEACSLAGTVTDARTGLPVAGAGVLALPPGGGFVHGAKTDAQGHFEIRELLPGSYTLQVMNAPGYVGQFYGGKSWMGQGAVLSLAPGTKVTGLVFRLFQLGSMSGRVTDKQGRPLANVSVRTLRVGYSLYGLERLISSAHARTNEAGEYEMKNVFPGRYHVEASYLSRPQPKRPDELFGCPIPVEVRPYIPMFYPDAPSLPEAAWVRVGSGEKVTGKNFTLASGRTYRVSGRVSGTWVGGKLRPLLLLLTPRGLFDVSSPYERAACADASGRFTLLGVFPGSYRLWAINAGWGAAKEAMYLGLASVQVGQQDLDAVHIEMKIAAPKELWGRLIARNGASGQFGSNLLYLSAEVIGGGSYAGLKAAGDRFDLKLPAGSYRFEIERLAEDSYLESARQGGRDVLGEPILVKSSGASDPLELVISGHGGEVSGTVLGRNGEPAFGATAVLVPDPPLRRANELYKTAVTDQWGRFDMHGVRPGTYTLSAWESMEDYDWFDPSVQKAAEGQSVKVVVKQGEMKTLQLTAVPAVEVPEPGR